MGAFGRMLIEYLGGDINAYEGNYPRPKEPKKSKKELDKERLELEEEHLAHLQKTCEDLIKRGNLMLKSINDNEIIAKRFTNPKTLSKFIKWREKFLKDLNK